MKQNRKLLFTIVVLIVGFASFAFAQMMGGNHDHSTMKQNGSSSKTCTMKDSEISIMDSPMNSMVQQNSRIEDNLKLLESHLEDLLKVEELDLLKDELQSNIILLNEIQTTFSEHQEMCSMMSEMHSQKMTGTMMNSNLEEDDSDLISNSNSSGCCAGK